MTNLLPEAPWWDEGAEFFGDFYIRGDNSQEGHLAARRLSLPERTLFEVDGVVGLLGLTKRCRVLDIPCGYGRHSIELARRGHIVTGADLNAVHIARAMGDTESHGVSVKFERQNMLALAYREEFDAVINMFYSFGFFETDDENLSVLRRFYEALLPGGKFLMHTDVNVPRIRTGGYKTHEVRNLVGGGRLWIDERFDETTRRIEGQWMIENGSMKSSRTYSVRVYEVPEFVQMCLDVGFVSCSAMGDWNGTPYSSDAEEIIFVAQK